MTRWPALDVAAKRARLQQSLQVSAGLADAIKSSAAAADRVAAGLWRADPSVWSPEPARQKEIGKWLGWMTSPLLMADSIDRLETFAAGIKAHGFTDVVLLGMGGSSLAPEVLRAVIGVAPGWPRFHMLDSTDPAAVRAAATPPATTLYLVSSKSGTTIEPNSFAAHFRKRLEDAGVAQWADHFVAITDEGTALDQHARVERFRDLFINPSDIGGRYSALSFFGMVPAALMGQDVGEIIGWALAMLTVATRRDHGGDRQSRRALGRDGRGARAGRDKLTLVAPPALDAFGLWVEQLIAESTGKNGTGIVPIAGEPLADPAIYGGDRLFVQMRVHDTAGEDERDAGVRALKAAQAPVVEIVLPTPLALGAEFMRWEIATAVAGAILTIDPFDQPTSAGKDATNVLLAGTVEGSAPIAEPARARRHLADVVGGTRRAAGAGGDALLKLLHAGDYFALLAYLGPDPAGRNCIPAARSAPARVATMFFYRRAIALDRPIATRADRTGVRADPAARDGRADSRPAASFGTLELAQAVATSLDAAGHRAVRALAIADPALARAGSALLKALPGNADASVRLPAGPGVMQIGFVGSAVGSTW